MRTRAGLCEGMRRECGEASADVGLSRSSATSSKLLPAALVASTLPPCAISAFSRSMSSAITALNISLTSAETDTGVPSCAALSARLSPFVASCCFLTSSGSAEAKQAVHAMMQPRQQSGSCAPAAA